MDKELFSRYHFETVNLEKQERGYFVIQLGLHSRTPLYCRLSLGSGQSPLYIFFFDENSRLCHYAFSRHYIGHCIPVRSGSMLVHCVVGLFSLLYSSTSDGFNSLYMKSVYSLRFFK